MQEIPDQMLSVRMTARELRHYKMLAAKRGLSMQEAVRQALQLWDAKSRVPERDRLEEFQGQLAGVDVEDMIKRERAAERARDER